MEEQLDRLVKKTWAKYQDLPRSKRLMIAVSGVPGSGKTTMVALAVKRLNALHHDQSPALPRSEDVAAFIPLDGYHLTRAQLSAMPDPDTAHARRGAAYTFDPAAYLKLVKSLREPLTPESCTIYAPSFDHAVKDPVYDDIPIHPSARILIFDGLYCSLGTGAPEWKEAAQMMDELWFVDVDFEVAKQRLIKRHVKAGIAKDEEDAAYRAENNDLVNGKQIVEGRLPIQEMIHSNEDFGWRPEEQDLSTVQS